MKEEFSGGGIITPVNLPSPVGVQMAPGHVTGLI